MSSTAPERIAVAFARVLRGVGLAVPIGAVLTFTDALGRVGVERETDVYWAARATLVVRPEDIGLFDQAFAVFWHGMRIAARQPDVVRQTVTIAVDDEEAGDDDGRPHERDGDPTLVLRFSAAETLRQRDFASYDDDELRQAQQLMEQLRFAGPPRASSRTRPDRRGAKPDIRATMRHSLRAGGEPIRRAWRDPGERLRRLVLLLDISGSMEPYARALLRFVQAAVAGRQRVEAFALGTRLTRMTKELESRDPDLALRNAAEQVHDWSGGTRLGECLRRFNDDWGARGMARGAIVVVLSDGWDRGDPKLLGEQMQRLSRVTHRLVWVNPLKVTPGYAPLARGMAAALPFVDDFVEGHSLAAMEQLAEVISTTGVRRPSSSARIA